MGDLGHASLDQLWKSAKIIARASITPDIVKAVQAAREPGCVFAGSRLIIMAVYRGADDVMEIVLMYMYVHILQLLNAGTLTEHRTDQQIHLRYCEQLQKKTVNHNFKVKMIAYGKLPFMLSMQ